MQKEKSVEDMAMKCAMKFEISQGRNPIDVSKNKKHPGYDIISGNLKIEVKGRGKDNTPHMLLNENNIKAVENIKSKHYRLYVVMNPKRNPKLIVFTKEEILDKKTEERRWRVPLRQGDFQNAIRLK